MGMCRAIGSCVTPETVSGQDRKPHSEIVAQLERKERRAANHAFELQWAVDNKRQLLSQAEEKEELEKTHAKQVRHFARKPHDPDSTSEASAYEEEEEGESEAGDGKEGEVEMENVVERSDQVSADLPREDHVEAGRSLPP